MRIPRQEAPNRARLAILSLVLGGLLGVAPTAFQTNSPSPRRTVAVNGYRAVAGEVLVKLRRTLAAGELSAFERLVDAEPSDAVGLTDLRRIHSRQFDVPALLDFLA